MHISLRADAFAPTAVLVAMYAGEDLHIRGAISPRLAYNLFEYREIFHAWYPRIFQRGNQFVNIDRKRLFPIEPNISG